MHLPAAAFVGYIATFVIAVAAAVVHPWFEVEAHFVKAVTGMSAAVAAAAVSTTSAAESR